MKVVPSDQSNSWSVVPDDYGELRTNSQGQKWTHLPLPICRVPLGHNRTDSEAKALAEKIAAALTGTGLCRHDLERAEVDDREGVTP